MPGSNIRFDGYNHSGEIPEIMVEFFDLRMK